MARVMDLDLGRIFARSRPHKLPHERAYTGRSGAGELVYPPRPAPPPSGYTAPAVHFDVSTYLVNAALAATDGKTFSCSFWANNGADPNSQAPVVFAVDPAGSYLTNAFGNGTAGEFQEQVPVSVSGGASVTLYPTATVPAGQWFHILASVDVTTTNARKAKVYLNDIDVTPANLNVGAAGNILFNGLPLWVGFDSFSGDEMRGDMSDVWIAPNVSLLNGSGDIPVATRRLFISASGKPVNPSGFPASAVLLSGNASTFATNQGSGGAFTTTGALTNASTSPST